MAEVRKSRSPDHDSRFEQHAGAILKYGGFASAAAGIAFLLYKAYNVMSRKGRSQPKSRKQNSEFAENSSIKINPDHIFTKIKLQYISDFFQMQKELRGRMEHEKNLIGEVDCGQDHHGVIPFEQFKRLYLLHF